MNSARPDGASQRSAVMGMFWAKREDAVSKQNVSVSSVFMWSDFDNELRREKVALHVSINLFKAVQYPVTLVQVDSKSEAGQLA